MPVPVDAGTCRILGGMAERHRLEITLSDVRLAQLDRARGHEPRASFVKRALEQALAPQAERNPPGEKKRQGPSIRDTWAR